MELFKCTARKSNVRLIVIIFYCVQPKCAQPRLRTTRRAPPPAASSHHRQRRAHAGALPLKALWNIVVRNPVSGIQNLKTGIQILDKPFIHTCTINTYTFPIYIYLHIYIYTYMIHMIYIYDLKSMSPRTAPQIFHFRIFGNIGNGRTFILMFVWKF